jgi:6-phosphogluconolactonase (cycloisomerase 2 family)
MVEPSATGGQVLYLVDQNQRTLTVYQYDPNKGKLKLSASRHFGADQQLLEFNNEEPHVADIERLSRSGK